MTKSDIKSISAPLLYTLPLRLFLAYEWLNSGIGKIESISADSPTYFGRMAGAFAGWAKSNPYPWMGDFLNSTATPNVATIITVVAVTEVLVGSAFLLGFLIRPASVWGIVMNAFFYLAAGHTSASTSGVNLVMMGAQLSMFLLSAGRFYGIDMLLHKRFPTIRLW